MMLTEREKIDITDDDVGWMVYADVSYCWSTGGQERERN
jgi:hypothetical protein